MSNGLIVNPSGETATVTITSTNSGDSLDLFSDINLTVPASNPASISTSTTFYTDFDGLASVSILIGGVEYATVTGAAASFTFGDGGVGSISAVSRYDLDQSVLDSATYQPVGDYALITSFAVQSEVPNLDNTAVGSTAMQLVDGTVGHGAYSSTAVGANALAAFLNGHSTAAFGANALENVTSGAQNTGLGMNALRAVTTGNNNTAVGKSAAEAITTASDNVAIGYATFHDMVTGTKCTALGTFAGYTDGTTSVPDGLSNATFIGHQSVGVVSNSMFLGGVGSNRVNVFIGSIGTGMDGLGCLVLREKVTIPTVLPQTSGALYVDSGALKYRGTAGTVTVVAPS
jgi:hypothetical protein